MEGIKQGIFCDDHYCFKVERWFASFRACIWNICNSEMFLRIAQIQMFVRWDGHWVDIDASCLVRWRDSNPVSSGQWVCNNTAPQQPQTHSYVTTRNQFQRRLIVCSTSTISAHIGFVMFTIRFYKGEVISKLYALHNRKNSTYAQCLKIKISLVCNFLKKSPHPCTHVSFMSKSSLLYQ